MSDSKSKAWEIYEEYKELCKTYNIQPKGFYDSFIDHYIELERRKERHYGSKIKK